MLLLLLLAVIMAAFGGTHGIDSVNSIFLLVTPSLILVLTAMARKAAVMPLYSLARMNYCQCIDVH